MEQDIHKFQEQLKNRTIIIKNKFLMDILYKFEVFFYTNNFQNEKEAIQQRNDTKIVIIDEYKIDFFDYFIICLDYKIIIFQVTTTTEKDISNIKTILANLNDYEKYFIPKCYDTEKANTTEYENFLNEIQSFSKEFRIKNQDLESFWNIIVKCLCGFIIKKGYQNLRKKTFHYYNEKFIEIQEKYDPLNNNYVILRLLGRGSEGIVYLIYYFEHESIYALKIPKSTFYLNEREWMNYMNLRYPFIVHYFGYIVNNNEKYLLLEYVEGQTLDKYNLEELSNKDKYNIMFELLLTFRYLHSQKRIYRDLKLENIIINQNHDAILIDFDRLINIDETFDENRTQNFSNPAVAEDKIKTYSSDIYSLGYIFHYILYGIFPRKDKDKLLINEGYFFGSCLSDNPNERPNICELIKELYIFFLSKLEYKTEKEQDLIALYEKHFIKEYETYDYLNIAFFYYDGKYINRNINTAIHYLSLAVNQNDKKAQFMLGFIYNNKEDGMHDINKAIYYYSLAVKQNYVYAEFNLGVIYYEGIYVKLDINKAIYYFSLAANQNIAKAQYNLGQIYYEGKYIECDINKAIHYYLLAANQNFKDAQFKLGVIYYEGIYVERDINKSIYYYSLAANQNIAKAQYNLGQIYYEGKYIECDINKAIHYLSLAANQTFKDAQFKLGVIYYEGIYVERDINKSIYYYSLAANQNFPDAQYNLGQIYYERIYIERDINKAIHYYSLAANQNYPRAQNNLGSIYYLGEYVERDINKAIYYFSLAANQNFTESQYNLGLIYYEGKYVEHDINKAIHYYSLAANNKYIIAQFKLGIIYYEGIYVERDINKSIYYFSLAANQNFPKAQYNLGLIYYEGKYVDRDINKIIHYFSLAANQNYLYAEFYLGIIYYEGKYVERSINKAIYYFSLAASQNFAKAQYNLGQIYYEGKYIERDINKAIQYYSLAANQNHLYAEFYLGVIYYEGKYIERNINKAIHYYSLASNQNDIISQFNLGNIYYEGKYILRNIHKAIHYFTLAANQNYLNAQFMLGVIYQSDRNVKHDIDKAIHYYLLASNQNDSLAQFNLGTIYYLKQYNRYDINKAIHYFTLAANNNLPQAQFNLGLIYYEGKSIKKDINKSIYYYLRAANQNFSQAQFNLGIFYYKSQNYHEKMKGRYYITLASKNNDRQANFAHGFLLHAENKIEEAIHYYKEASSFKINFAKNNLGVIYKHGCGNIKRNRSNAIIYFNEAIQQKEDYLSMYNLAHTYLFDETNEQDLDKAIELLIRSLKSFNHSLPILCIALIKKYEFNIKTIEYKLKKRVDICIFSFIQITDFIICSRLCDRSVFEKAWEFYRNRDFVYNVFLQCILSSEIHHSNDNNILAKYPNAKDISTEFYNGFGKD